MNEQEEIALPNSDGQATESQENVAADAKKTPRPRKPKLVIEKLDSTVVPADEEKAVVASESVVEIVSSSTLEITSDSNLETLESDVIEPDEDFSHLSLAEINAICQDLQKSVMAEGVNLAEYKKADSQLKGLRPVVDALKKAERATALEKYISENGEEEGFEWHEGEEFEQFEQIYKQVREVKNKFFNDLEKKKEKNFEIKTEILNQLRHLADAEDGSLGTIKENLAALKKLQNEWKDAGNFATPHNNTLWQTYHALIDRFYSNRGIYFELLDLDRKKNLNAKVELCSKLEQSTEGLTTANLTSKIIQEANHLFEEFKHIGPAPKEANELLWQRFKSALDLIYNLRRAQAEEQKGAFEQNYEAKKQVMGSLEIFTSFKSDSINDWLDQTKAIDILQQQWNAIKGPMPKEKGREISRDFWAGVKTFYRNKGEFFKALEAKREDNLKQKQALCEQVEQLVATGEDNAENTKLVIALQENWRKIGHVPDKFRNKIYDRFKAACDAYFAKKREKSSAIDKEFLDNLAAKEALCAKLEAEAGQDADLGKINAYKKEWAAIGFVPKANMQAIQKRYIAAINSYVGSIGKLSKTEREAVSLQAEVEVLKGSNDKNNIKDLGRKESDIRNKINYIENDLATLKNNLEFFAKSKNADKLKQDFEVKIKKGEQEIADLKHKLKLMRQANQ